MARAPGMAPGARVAGTTLHVTRYLLVSSNGTTSSSSRPPSVGVNEVVMELAIAIPLRLFQRPILTAQVTIPENAVMAERLAAEVVPFVERALGDATGLEVQVDLRPRTIPLADPEAPK